MKPGVNIEAEPVVQETVTSQTRPSVARKAKASGTPAKLEATPENVRVEARTSGQAAAHDGHSKGEADKRRRAAEAMLTLMLKSSRR